MAFTRYGGQPYSEPILSQNIHIHLRRIRKFIKSMDLVDFLDTPEMDRTHQAVTSHYGPKVDEKT
jgi:hypothetical protein